MKHCRGFVLLTVLSVTLGLMVNIEAKAEEKESSKVLNVYNWEDYFGETTLSDFEKTFGVKVNLETFEDEEELSSNLLSYPTKYDVIVTSGAQIRDFIQVGRLAEINVASIPNLKHIDPRFRNPTYDPGHKHSVPYLWGTTGVAVNRKFVKGDENTWSILWNPKYEGKIAMLNNPEEVIGAALKYLGYSLNTRDPFKLHEAKEKLIEQNRLITGYLDVMTIQKKLVSNELWAAQIYSGEGVSASDKNEDLEYIIPEQGGAMWVDCLAIPKGAKHKDTAVVFINYILEPKVSAQIANYLWYANCNQAARPHTEEEILKSPSLYPPADTLEKCEFFLEPGSTEEETRYNEMVYKTWAELRVMKKRATLKDWGSPPQ